MKRSFICISLIILLTGFVEFHEHVSDKMKAFKWLIGSWQMNTAKGFIAEEWKTSGERGYAGKEIRFLLHTDKKIKTSGLLM